MRSLDGWCSAMNLRRAASDPAVRSIANVQTTILVADIHDSQAKDNGITYIRKLSPLRCAIVQIFSVHDGSDWLTVANVSTI